jgi:hypothetical protein
LPHLAVFHSLLEDEQWALEPVSLYKFRMIRREEHKGGGKNRASRQLCIEQYT